MKESYTQNLIDLKIKDFAKKLIKSIFFLICKIKSTNQNCT